MPNKYKNFISKIIEQNVKKNKNLSIHTRFPPEPNGHLHIGHAKSICLNFNLANIYNGNCNLRFDDTNPVQENIKYIKSIKYDINWLGYKWHRKTFYASEYFSQLYQYAQELIKKNLAYVDHLNKKEIRKYRGTLTVAGKNSPYRNRTVEENLEMFHKMKTGGFSEGEACLRAKINMSSSLIIMRDPVLYRIILSKHHQTKTKWCIYPTYDFAHCLCDSLEKITHSLCTLEFQDNRYLYDWILKNTSVAHYPKQYEFSRLNLEYSILSKRKLNILIEKNIVHGWDDPRMPTISGLRNKGYTPNAIQNFCYKIGITKQENLIEFSMLEHCIRNELNKTAIRAMAVLDPIKIFLYNIDDNYEEKLTIANHPHRSDLGFQTIIFTNTLYIERTDFKEKQEKNYKRLTLGSDIRLRHSYIITAEKVKKNKNGKITEIICYCDLNTLGKTPQNQKNPAVIHWVSIKNSISAKFNIYDHLFTIKNPEKEKDFLSYVNLKSITVKKGFIHKNLSENIQNKIKDNNPILSFQFERVGYFCIDRLASQKDILIFNCTVGLRNQWNLKNKKK